MDAQTNGPPTCRGRVGAARVVVLPAGCRDPGAGLQDERLDTPEIGGESAGLFLRLSAPTSQARS
jgi:hypothetical protein